MSRIRCTRYQRPGTTNHPHHLGTDVTFFLPRSHLKKTLINTWYNIPPPSILIILLHFMVFVCTWCSWCVLLIFFSFGLDDFFTRWCAWYLLRFCHLVTGTPTLQGFCADAHRFTLKCWWVVVGIGWTTFRVSSYESDSILVTQVRAITCCLLVLFITQSGSCTRRPPRLRLCCFPLHRRQISSNVTPLPLLSTATNT